MLFSPTLDQIVKVLAAKKYRTYESGDPTKRTLNLVGIRRATLSPDKFDDTIAIFNLMPGASDLMTLPITTEPSPHYLKHPVNKAGAAILAEGRYVDTHAISMHSPPSGNKHVAVCQRLGQVTVYRDNNKDAKLNLVNPVKGMFGINIHRGPANGDWDSNNTNYSAGCQVFADRDDFEIFMIRCKKERASTGINKFTYTLLNESDFN